MEAGTVEAETAVQAADVSPLLDDFQEKLARVAPGDARAPLLEKFEDPLTVKVVWRGDDRAVLGAALATVDGSGAELVFLHAMPKFATGAATARVLDELLARLPPQVERVRAMDRLAHRWLHLPAADARGLLLARGFHAFDRVLLARDLKRAIPAAPSLPAGFALGAPDPSHVEELADFAFRAYRGTTDFSIIAPDASPQAYERLYRRFLSGELGDYARDLSFLLAAPDGSTAAVLHTIFVGREPFVGDLSVLAPHRRKGLGRFLLITGLTAFRKAGFDRTGLTVTAQNTAAYNLYRSVGFEVERSGEVFLLAR